MDFIKIWKRVKYDFNNDHFLKNALEMEIIEKNMDDWALQLKRQIETDTYTPKSIYICDVPKGKGLIRPGTHLTLTDNVYYTELLNQAYEPIYNFLKWSQGNIDFAYMLTGDNISPNWLKNHFQGWNPFREISLKYIDRGYPYVIITDITGCYDNINHQTLQSDLRAAGVSGNTTNRIIKALSKWSIVNGKGIPQSCSSSHILAKVYLNPIDLALQNAGFAHVRYVDDIRIFCKSKIEAKLALIELSRFVRERGLTLNSSKTKIHTAEEAQIIIDGVQVTIERVKKRLKEEKSVFDFTGYFDNDYIDEETVKQLFRLNENPTVESVQVIEEAFRAYFIDGEKDFDKTLFRFLLARLGEAKSKYAIDYCFYQFERHPEETPVLLSYYLKCGALLEANEAIQQFFKSGEAVYDYQNHKIMNWYADFYQSVPDDLIQVIRQFAFNSKYPFYVRSAAIRFIGKFGNIADLDKLQQLYTQTADELEQAQIICSLKNMETGKRNTFYGKIQTESNIIKTAVEIAKA